MKINGNFAPYAFKEAIKNVKLNGLMSSASIFVLIACLVLIGSSILITANINKLISKIEGQNEIVLFLEDANSAEQNNEIGLKLKEINNVSKEVIFVSKEQALDELKLELKDQAYLLEQIEDDNPLRHSYHIKLIDLNKYDEVLYTLKSIEGIAKIGDNKDFISTITKIREVITVLSIWIIIILLFVSLFIISNTVRIAMFTRKLEINIMKFVGATDNFIRLPFLIEGIILGAIAGVVAIFVEWVIYSKIIVPMIFELGIFKPVLFFEIGYVATICFVIGGIIIGVIGSILPMRKYLRV